MIGAQGEAAFYKNDNWKDRVVLNIISVLGGCCYLVRDSIYGVERTAYVMGQFPDANAGGIASYVRGNAWTVPGSAVYNKDAPATDRTYFIGPIY